MSAPASLSRPLSDADLLQVREFINWCMANGVPPGVTLERLDPDAPNAPKDMPPARPGVRHFYLRVGLAPGVISGDDFACVIGVYESGTVDIAALVRADLCAWIAEIEQHQCVADIGGHHLIHRRMPLWEQRDEGHGLTKAAADTNAVLDTIREAMADPRTWSPIRHTAVMVGHFMGVRIESNGRRIGLVIAEAEVKS